MNYTNYFARIGSAKAMQHRQEQRLAGKLNRQFPPIGLRKCAAKLGLIRDRQPEPLPLLKAMPVTALPSQPMPQKPRKGWRNKGRSGN